MLRKSFELAEGFKTATVYICGLGLYEMQVNGKQPDDSVLNTAHTQYEDTVNYNAYDVTDLLTTGENAIAVELGNGFYNLTTNITLNHYNGVWRDDPKLLLELHVEYANGETQVIVSDETWRCYDNGPVRVNNIYCGEQYDATMEVEGWTNAAFDDSGWNTVRMADAPTGKLKFENMEPMRRVKAITPRVEKVNDSTWRVYTGEYCTGWAKIAFDTKRMSMIEIRYYQRESEITKGLYVEKDGERFDLQTSPTLHGLNGGGSRDRRSAANHRQPHADTHLASSA
jgi:alpha-L-rhamnosidase